MEENQPPEKPGSKTDLHLKFTEESLLLIVAVKLPDEAPRVMPIKIETDELTFLSDFSATWRDLGEKVRAEFTRGALERGTGRGA